MEQLQYLGNIQCVCVCVCGWVGGWGELDQGLKECSICLEGKKWRTFKWEEEKEEEEIR